MRDQPTLEHVAEVAGVSRATVSRVVRGEGNVASGTRELVQAAVEQVGYVPNQAARSLVTRRTDTVALVVAENEQRVFGEPFFADVARGVAQELAVHDRQMVLVMASTPGDEQRFLRYLVGGHVDGVMLLSLRDDDPLPATLDASGIPMSMAGPPPAGLGIPWVDADNVGGARLATEHLLGRGRRRIATITGPPSMPVGRDRREGWARAQRAVGVEPDHELVEPGDFSDRGGELGMAALLDRVPDLDGVFAASDLMAQAALRVLRDAGRRVPEDVAVVGFDDAPIAALSVPPLTTVRQPVRELGVALVRLLVAAIEDRDEPTEVMLPTELVVRASS